MPWGFSPGKHAPFWDICWKVEISFERNWSQCEKIEGMAVLPAKQAFLFGFLLRRCRFLFGGGDFSPEKSRVNKIMRPLVAQIGHRNMHSVCIE